MSKQQSEQPCEHSWRFDGDDPYIICSRCGTIQNALTGQEVKQFTPISPKKIESSGFVYIRSDVVEAQLEERERLARIDELKSICGWSTDERQALVLPVEVRHLTIEKQVTANHLTVPDRIAELSTTPQTPVIQHATHYPARTREEG